MASRSTQLLSLFALLACACDMEFTPYNEIDKYRLLAIGADDPWLAPGQRTTLRTLEANPRGAPVKYAWSWCPFVGPSNTGYPCAVTRESLQRGLDDALGTGVLTVPPFELGREPTAEYFYELPARFFQVACEALKRTELPEFVTVPDCSERFTITIRVEVTPEGETPLVGIKELSLVYEDGELNTNPEIGDVLAFLPEWAGTPLTLTSTGAPPVLARDKTYTLEVLVDLDQAQPFLFTPKDGSPPTTRRENLVFTWFVDAGELADVRTGFVEGEVPLERARRNDWTTPRKADFPGNVAHLFFVVRDGRDGISWKSRTVRFED